jgi:PKD repeat protein
MAAAIVVVGLSWAAGCSGRSVSTPSGIPGGNPPPSATAVAAGRSAVATRSSDPLLAACRAQTRSGPSPLRVKFFVFPNGGDGSYDYLWQFGDGEVSANRNPAHVYLFPGDYEAVVTVFSGAESVRCSRSITVIAAVSPELVPGPPGQAPTPTLGTVTITASGVSPKTITIAVGGRVTFINNDSAFHEPSSDPHPIHTDCPQLNLPVLAPGQSADSGIFTVARTCTYHDHLQSTNAAFQGTVIVR